MQNENLMIVEQVEWNKLPSHSLNLKIYISIKFDHKIQRFIVSDEDLFETINVCVLLPCKFLFCHSLSVRKVLNSCSCDCPRESLNFQCIHKSRARKVFIRLTVTAIKSHQHATSPRMSFIARFTIVVVHILLKYVKMNVTSMFSEKTREKCLTKANLGISITQEQISSFTVAWGDYKKKEVVRGVVVGGNKKTHSRKQKKCVLRRIYNSMKHKKFGS